MEQKELPDGKYLLEGLGRGPESMLVWSADGSRHAKGWHLVSVDLGMRSGRPMGAVHFEREEGGQRVGLGVRWDHVYDQLHCFVFEGECNDTDREHLDRDARHRVGTWMAVHAEVGSALGANAVAQRAMFEAAHLLPERSRPMLS